MTRGTWILVALALLVVWAGMGVWSTRTERTPAALLASARRHVEGAASIDEALRGEPIAAAMSELELAIAGARAQGDGETAREALLLRAEMLESRGARAAAIADYERLLSEYMPGDLGLLARMGRAHLALEHVDQALAACEQMLATDPDSAEGRTLRSQVLFREGQRWLESCRTLLDEHLAREQADEGAKLAERVAALEPSDPLRPALLHDLADLFPPEAADAAHKAQELAEQAGQRWVSARHGFAESFRFELRADATFGMLDILSRAGRFPEAVDFGLATRKLETAFDSTCLQALVLALSGMGRPKAATKLIEDTEQADASLPMAFRLRLCRILYDAKMWKRLRVAAWQAHSTAELIDSEDEKRDVTLDLDFYQGVAEIHDMSTVTGQALLERFVAAGAQGPFESALPRAFLAIATAERFAKRSVAERAAIEAALSLEPELDGEAWLRLAEIQSEAGDPAVNIERSYAEALRLLPRRDGELEPHWREQGEKSLIEQQIDPVLWRETLRRDGRWYPPRECGAFELLTLARLHRDKGEPQGAVECGEFLLRKLPGFLPALDLLIETDLGLGKTNRAVERMVQRLELAGPDETVLKLLRKVPLSALEPKQWLAVMRADPRHTGLLTLARGLYEAGHGEQALPGFNLVGYDELGDAGRLLAGQILFEAGRHAEADKLLSAVRASSPEIHAALRVRVEAALAAKDDALLEGALHDLVGLPRQQREAGLAICTSLAQHEDYEQALRVAVALDSDNAARNASVLLRRAELELALERASEARTSLERLRGLTDSGEAELGLVFTTVLEHDWSALRSAVDALAPTRLAQTPLQQVCLLALGERTEEARATALAALSNSPGDPLWVVAADAIDALRLARPGAPAELGAQGGADRERLQSADCALDPRLALVLMCALEQPGYASFASAALGRLSPPGCGPLVNYWMAVAAERVGRPTRALALLERLNEERPELGAAWDLRERATAEVYTRADAPQRLLVRQQRRKALGMRPGEEGEEQLVQARVLAQQGKAEAAAAVLQQLVASHPEDAQAALELARARVLKRDWAAAAEAYAGWAAHAEASTLTELLPEALDVLARCRENGALPAAALRAHVESISARVPDDPEAALARAEVETVLTPQAPQIGVGRAFATLEGFRAAHAGISLEKLRAGSARHWFQFYLRLDPGRAQRLAQSELERAPDTLESWLMVGEAMEAQGRREDALLQYEDVRAMLPDARSLRHIAMLVADLGSDHNRVEQMIERARKLEGQAEPDMGLQFLRARSMVNAGPQTLDAGIQLLQELWMRRSEAAGVLRPEQIGQRLGTSLLHRGRPADYPKAAALLDAILPRVEDPMEKDLVLALDSIAHNVAATPN